LAAKKNNPEMPPGVTLNGHELSVPCPECGSALTLKPSKYGSFYGCVRWKETKCCGAVGCHPGTNIPLGMPAKKEVRQLRIKAHKEFDELWMTCRMTRRAAYKWMQEKLGIPKAEAHIGQFNGEQCQKLIQLVAEEMASGHER
jgi:ssDNA-binding Zn-finger/Zn-ribbon topoisomerase 1